MNSKKRRERKQLITICIFAGVLVLLVIAYFAVRGFVSDGEEAGNNNPSDVGQPGTFDIIDENYQKVTALEYGYNGETLKLHIENQKWVLDDDPEYPIDQAKIVEMSQAVSDYGGFAKIVYDKSRVSAYGIDDPALDVTVTYLNDDNTTRSRRFIIGAKNNATGYYYFYEQGDSYIYAVNDSMLKYFEFSKISLFADSQTPTPNASDIISLTVEYDGGTYEYDAERDGVIGSEDTDHPVKKIMESMPKEANLQYPDLAAYGVDEDELSKYGLDEPSLKIKLTYNERTSVSASDGNATAQLKREREFTYLFGDHFTEGEGDDAVEYVYVCEEGSKVVFKASVDRFDGIYSAASGSGE